MIHTALDPTEDHPNAQMPLARMPRTLDARDQMECLRLSTADRIHNRLLPLRTSLMTSAGSAIASTASGELRDLGKKVGRARKLVNDVQCQHDVVALLQANGPHAKR
jgi:hypothetical protein